MESRSDLNQGGRQFGSNRKSTSIKPEIGLNQVELAIIHPSRFTAFSQVDVRVIMVSPT